MNETNANAQSSCADREDLVSGIGCPSSAASSVSTNRKFRRYWKHHSQMTEWFKNYGSSSKSQMKSGNQFGQWCQRMAHYHTSMAQWMQHLASYYSSWNQTWQQYQQHSHAHTCMNPAFKPRHNSADARLNSTGQHLGNQCPDLNGSKEESIARKHRKRKGNKCSKSKKKRKRKESCSDMDIGIQGLEIGEQFEMEITEDMVEFFTHSAKHRKERDAREVERQTQEADHVNLGEADIGKHKATVLPPSERPGIKRTFEMKKLYGQGAAMIHGMETAMQLNYDRNCDLQQPKLWPQLPIKITFH